MMLFAICIDPSIRTLAEILQHIEVGRNGSHPAVLAYADDVTIILQSPGDKRKIQETLEQYGAASGAKINTWIKKSKALAVGKWDTSVNIMGIQYQESVKFLGIHFRNTIHETILKSWTTVTDGIRAHAQDTYSRELNLYQRIQYVHNILLARAWFMAQIFPLPI
jgi:hypothetical protein